VSTTISGARDFVLPSDPVEVALTVQDKLRGGRGSSPERSNSALSVLAMRPGGSVVVPADYVQLLGDGVVDRGRRILDRIVADIRGRPVLGNMH
jgi:hypothetical protein